MGKQSQAELGKVEAADKGLDNKNFVRKPLPKIPAKEWEAFEKFADEECGSDWGMAFSRLIRETLIEPPAMVLLQDHENRITALELNLQSAKPQEEDPDFGVACDGQKVKEMIDNGKRSGD